MIEAKDKEQAVFELYRRYGLSETIYGQWGPWHRLMTLQSNQSTY